MLRAPRFDLKDFDRERKLELDALLQGPDDPSWIAGRAFRSLLYGPKHPYGKPGSGHAASLKAINLDDIRAFHAKYAANRSSLIIVGDVDPESLASTVDSTLGSWKTTGPAPVLRQASEAKAAPGVVYLADKPGAVQSVILVGRRWVDLKDPTYFATLIGNHVVGDDFLSRLNANLREKNGVQLRLRLEVRLQAGRVELAGEHQGPGRRHRRGPQGDPRRARRPGQGPPPDGRGDRHREGCRVADVPRVVRIPERHRGGPRRDRHARLPPDYLETYLDKLRGAPDDQIRKSMVNLIAPGERTILIVGDRASVESKLKAMGVKEVKIVDPDGNVVKPK